MQTTILSVMGTLYGIIWSTSIQCSPEGQSSLRFNKPPQEFRRYSSMMNPDTRSDVVQLKRPVQKLKMEIKFRRSILDKKHLRITSHPDNAVSTGKRSCGSVVQCLFRWVVYFSQDVAVLFQLFRPIISRTTKSSECYPWLIVTDFSAYLVNVFSSYVPRWSVVPKVRITQKTRTHLETVRQWL